MKKSDYFSKQIEDANELFMNAGGNEDWEDADGWEEADGDDEEDYEDYDDEEDFVGAFGDVEQMGFAGQPYMDARGRGRGMRPAPVSQAIIITAANTTTATVTNVEILDSLKRQLSTATSGISYGVGYSNVTYAELLSSIASGNPTFLCGQLRLSASGGSSANNNANVLETITVVVKDVMGKQQTLSLVPELDNYAQQTTQTDIYVPFYVNGLTSLKIANIYGSVTVTFKLFPAETNTQLDAIRQRAPQRRSNPKTNKALTR